MKMPKMDEPITPLMELFRFCLVHSGHHSIKMEDWPNNDLPIFIKFDHINTLLTRVSYWSSSFTNLHDPSEGLTWENHIYNLNMGSHAIFEAFKNNVFNKGGDGKAKLLSEDVDPNSLDLGLAPWLRKMAHEDRVRMRAEGKPGHHLPEGA